MVSRSDINLWSILKHCIGKELSKITMPVVFNEPLSFLQRLTECMEYIDYLDRAAKCDDPIERMELVAAFAVASLSSNWMRLNKPFNPLLGETFELVRDDVKVRVMCEQVSHHPPISAYQFDSPGFILRGSCKPKLKFWGKSVEVKPDSTFTLTIPKYDETYTWVNVNCCVHNIIIGTLWFEQYGTMEVKNHSNGLRAVLDFKSAGWFGKDLNRVEGFIIPPDSKKVRFIYGRWTDYLKSVDFNEYEKYMNDHQEFRVPNKPGDDELNNLHEKVKNKRNRNTRNGDQRVDSGEIPKSDSSNSLDIPNSKLLWVVSPRPPHSKDYYNFTYYTMRLNEFDEKVLADVAPTDSRRRPDIRLLEQGDLDEAAAEKNRLEEKQREVRKIRKKNKDTWAPLWFEPVKNKYLNCDDWASNGTYWQRDYTRCDDIF